MKCLLYKPQLEQYIKIDSCEVSLQKEKKMYYILEITEAQLK